MRHVSCATVLLVSLAVLLLVGASSAARGTPCLNAGCDCDAPPQTEKYIVMEYERATAVFVGKVVRVAVLSPKARRECLEAEEAAGPPPTSEEDPGVTDMSVLMGSCHGTRTKILVSKVWKGVTSRTVTLIGGQSNCDKNFEVGREYIVYAWGRSQDDLGTSLCSLTRTLGAAKLDLELLGPSRVRWRSKQ